MLDWLEKHQLPCFYHQVLHVECPMCGFQRALILLLKGDLVGSIVLFPALIPTILLFILLLSWMVFRKPCWKIIKLFLQFDLALIMMSYIGRFFM
jgi:hypothetical protein